MEAEITIQGSILYTEDGLAEFTYFSPSIWQTNFLCIPFFIHYVLVWIIWNNYLYSHADQSNIWEYEDFSHLSFKYLTFASYYKLILNQFCVRM